MLTGVAPNSIVFADRQLHAAGTTPRAASLKIGRREVHDFPKMPKRDGIGFQQGWFCNSRRRGPSLRNPRVTTSFDVDVLEGNLTGADGVGPYSSTSSAGHLRRSLLRVARVELPFRGAMYRSAAYGAADRRGGAAGVAAANTLRRSRALRPLYGASACGYYPYPALLLMYADSDASLNREELFKYQSYFRAWRRCVLSPSLAHLPTPSHRPHGHKQACWGGAPSIGFPSLPAACASHRTRQSRLKRMRARSTWWAQHQHHGGRRIRVGGVGANRLGYRPARSLVNM